MSELHRRIEKRLQDLPAPADVKRGHFDARAVTKEGVELKIRLNVPPGKLGTPLIQAFHRTGDKLALVKALTKTPDSVLISLRPEEFGWLANAALCLCAGEHLAIIRKQFVPAKGLERN